jgi:hypothetical protein
MEGLNFGSFGAWLKRETGKTWDQLKYGSKDSEAEWSKQRARLYEDYEEYCLKMDIEQEWSI